ncbi:MAG: hypothetical protein J5616_06715 [Bacteroidaceae bacterium]|nr:hypothetical protein [Bacteroidaceae bacterium]
MKKVFVSFVIATMMASLMACGGKTEQNQEGQDSTAMETEGAEAAEEEAPSTTVESEAFTGVAPAGWEIVHVDEEGFQFKNRNAEGPLTPTVTVHRAYGTAIEAYESITQNPPKNLIGDVEIVEGMDIAGRTYTGFYFKTKYNSELNTIAYGLITDLDNGTPIYVTVENIDIDDDDVQAVFASIKEK